MTMWKGWMRENSITGRFETTLARFLGEKYVKAVDGCTLTGYLWRGCFYVTKVEFEDD